MGPTPWDERMEHTKQDDDQARDGGYKPKIPEDADAFPRDGGR
jgi:hypothetical protein